jgi:putative endonuclease
LRAAAKQSHQHDRKILLHLFNDQQMEYDFIYGHHQRFTHVVEAIAREKQIKGGSRKKKIELIEKNNPEWRDLSNDL